MKKIVAKLQAIAHRVSHQISTDNERGARNNLMEELFYDFNRSKKQVYWVNFQRGIFFGIGSVLGGTFVVVIGASLLGLFVDLPGGIGAFVKLVIEEINRR
ncbi:MAG: DUF5665 domain-containing protein [Candidatus Saccharimonadales bacterium]